MSVEADPRLPLTVVTGFLGSGKTTLIRSLLAHPLYANSALIVNEFGEIGLDHHLFFKTDERMTLLRDGCACCARRDDLVDALRNLARRVDRGEIPTVDRVILETTGLADPAPILHTLLRDPVLSRRYRVDRVVSTIDAMAGKENLERYPEAVRQVTAAHDLVITKGDLASAADASRLKAIVSRINPAANVRSTASHLLEPRVFANEYRGRLDDQRFSGKGGSPLCHKIDGRIATLSLVISDLLDWRMFGFWLTMLLYCHGERVLRVKGLLDVGESGPLLLDGVQHVVHAPRHLPNWPSEARQSELVFIVRDLDPEAIRTSFETFAAFSA